MSCSCVQTLVTDDVCLLTCNITKAPCNMTIAPWGALPCRHYVPTLEHYVEFLDSLAARGVPLGRALLLNPFEGQPLPPGCPHDLREARLDALDDKDR